jgi:hypothetical protein
MNWFRKSFFSSPVAMYRIRTMLFISLAWTIVDLFLYLRNVSIRDDIDYPYQEKSISAILLRSAIVLLVSYFMCWLFYSQLWIVFKKRSLSIIIFFLHFIIIKNISFTETIVQAKNYFLHTSLTTDSILFWLVML